MTTKRKEPMNEASQVDVHIQTLTCERCQHAWVPRVPRVTKCPACKSALWNIPRGNQGKKKTIANRRKGA